MSAKSTAAGVNGMMPAAPCPGVAMDIPLRGKAPVLGISKRELFALVIMHGLAVTHGGALTSPAANDAVMLADDLLDALALIPAGPDEGSN